MTRSLLVIASATLVALGIPISGMTPVGASSSAAKQVQTELVRANQEGIVAESAVGQGKEHAALTAASQVVRDLGRVQAAWPHRRDAVTTGMLKDLTITMNTVLGLDREFQAVGWPGTRSVEHSLMATWNAGVHLLRLSHRKSLGTTSSPTVLPPPTVTTVTTMPSPAVARTALPTFTSSTSVTAASHPGDPKHEGHQGKKNRGDGHTQPGHHPAKHHRGDKHHGH